jgi:hypothetical protein
MRNCRIKKTPQKRGLNINNIVSNYGFGTKVVTTVKGVENNS